jgi:hypothetical protein
MRKIGDVSRKRRLFGSEAQVRWYARCRATRFARRYSLAPQNVEAARAETAINRVAIDVPECVAPAA